MATLFEEVQDCKRMIDSLCHRVKELEDQVGLTMTRAERMKAVVESMGTTSKDKVRNAKGLKAAIGVLSDNGNGRADPKEPVSWVLLCRRKNKSPKETSSVWWNNGRWVNSGWVAQQYPTRRAAERAARKVPPASDDHTRPFPHPVYEGEGNE